MTTTATRVSAFLSAPASPKLPVLHNKQLTCSNKLKIPPITHSKSHSLKTIPLVHFASSSSPPALEEDQEDANEPSPPPPVTRQQDSGEYSGLRGCKACGKEEMESGCNGEGRIQGGIATVPGFGWWPIKAYRPCPAYLATGGRYKRRGQSMDEVTSGRIGRAVIDDKPR